MSCTPAQHHHKQSTSESSRVHPPPSIHGSTNPDTALNVYSICTQRRLTYPHNHFNQNYCISLPPPSKHQSKHPFTRNHEVHRYGLPVHIPNTTPTSTLTPPHQNPLLQPACPRRNPIPPLRRYKRRHKHLPLPRLPRRPQHPQERAATRTALYTPLQARSLCEADDRRVW